MINIFAGAAGGAVLLALAPAAASDAPIIMSSPPAVQPFKQCVHIEQVQHMVEAGLKASGDPPAVVMFSMLPDGEGVVSVVIVDQPGKMNFVFDGECLARSFASD